MRKKNLFFVIIIVLITLVSCDDSDKETICVIDFEDVLLDNNGLKNGSDLSGNLKNGNYYNEIQSGTVKLLNIYSKSEWGDYWTGFSVSSKADITTSGYLNQYSTIAGKGADNSVNFALAYDSATIILPYIINYQKPKSMMVTNSTFTYFDIKNGSNYSKKFENGDWFKVIIKGAFQEKITQTVEFYLADFRNGKSSIIDKWEKIDISSLGTVEKITISFDSSDKNIYGVRTPKYVCIDNIVLLKSEN